MPAFTAARAGNYLPRSAEESQDNTSGNAKLTNVGLPGYCQRADAVAACFVRDVLQLKEISDMHKDTSFWYLGTVPCRNVKLVGILVSAAVYEKRTLYTLDDGSGVIQCVHLHPQPPKGKERTPDPDSVSVSLTKNEVPKLLFEIGETVRITGRVNRWMDYRQIYVTEMESVWPNEELQHWINVANLHQTHYSKPFVIPPLPLPAPHTPSKRAASQLNTPLTTSALVTPSTVCSTVPSIHNASTSPSRLRHPARLRSKDHQALIFKLYLNHFIHFASRLFSMSSCHDDSGPEAAGGDDHVSFSRRHLNESPSKRLRRLHCNLNEETSTPRASRLMLNATSKQSKPVKPKPQSTSSTHATQPEIRGFTLSYLRRVPELSHLAYAVVHKEVKTRARDAKRRETKADRVGLTMVRQGQGNELKESTARKVKRLFGWAVRELRYEGAVIVQDADAAVWRGPPPLRGIWKPIEANASLDKTAFSTGDAFSSSANVASFGDISNDLDEDQGELSDPSPNEESYVPLTPALLYLPIEKAIQALCERKKRQLLKEQQFFKPVSESASRMIKHFGAPSGPTAEEIQKYLQQVDDRWMYVGEYVVKDALKELCAPRVERVQKMGERWKLTLGRYVT